MAGETAGVRVGAAILVMREVSAGMHVRNLDDRREIVFAGCCNAVVPVQAHNVSPSFVEAAAPVFSN